jgi:hypothetical protein
MRRAALACLLLLWPGAAAAEPPWQVPAEGACAPTGGLRGWPLGEDAAPVPFKPGDTFEVGASETLRHYLPAELWNHRDKFFFEGMRLEIGPCFRDYAPPDFYRQAPGGGEPPRLTEDGGLEGYRAGAPFPPDGLAPDDPQAGLKWAWNIEQRWQGAGFRGRFRISDMVGRTHRAEPFEGEIFKLLLSGRADRAASDYRAPGARSYQWVAGGLFFMPFAAREYAWRQYRDLDSLTSGQRTDDLHAYLPQWRKVRRMSAVGIEGLHLPSFSVGVVPSQVLAVGGAGIEGSAAASGLGGVGDTGSAVSSITPRRNGFEGLELRPLLWSWRVLGTQDVLAPINAAAPSYPEVADRNFGPWGLSFASDRWDLRRAVVLEARIQKATGESEAARVLHYIDLQTMQPLYYISWDKSGELMDVGMYVGRWSEDRPDYPRWPDDPARAVRVIDPVGAAFANVREQGGWRRENWDTISTPPPDDDVRQLISVGEIGKRR